MNRFPKKLLTIIFISITACSVTDIRHDPEAFSGCVRFAQLSDPHIPSKRRSWKGVFPEDNLKMAVKELNALEPRPDFVLLTGDIAAITGEPEAYYQAEKFLSALEVPVHYVVGNHDNRDNLREVLLKEKPAENAPIYYSFKKESYRFIILDSTTGKSDSWGRFDNGQLEWLNDELQSHPDQITVIVLHHHSLIVDNENLYPLHNVKEFLGILDRHPQVLMVMNGHTHQAEFLLKNGIYFVSTRAVSYLYRNWQGGAGFRLYELGCGERLEVYDKLLGKPAVKQANPTEETIAKTGRLEDLPR